MGSWMWRGRWILSFPDSEFLESDFSVLDSKFLDLGLLDSGVLNSRFSFDSSILLSLEQWGSVNK